MQSNVLKSVQDIGPIECGEDAARHFAHEDGYKNLNHGSYGTYPIGIRSVLRHNQERVEARPDTFIRYEYRTHLLDESRKAIAEYVHAPAETCVLVPNTTNGIDTVLRNLVFSAGDVVVCFSTIYDSFYYTLDYLTEITPVAIKKIEITYPVSDERICDIFEATLVSIASEGRIAKVALFDTISSLPGVRMPFERLTELCRTYKVMSCIDGAHGVGHFPLHLENLDPDFFVSNCHKWLHVPRGCAVLYVPLRNQHLLRATLPTGFGYVSRSRAEEAKGTSNFVANFSSLGTLDDTPYLCIPAALEWRKTLTWGERKGEDAIMGYIHNLARRGGEAVASILGTSVLGMGEEDALRECGMTNVRLPLAMVDLVAGDPSKAARIGQWIMKTMNLEHHTAVNVFEYDDALWVRLSAQIYLTLRDFEHAAIALKVVCAKVDRSEGVHERAYDS